MKKGLIIGALILLFTVTAYASKAVDMATYKRLSDAGRSRCAFGFPALVITANEELDYALKYNLITRAAYDWGKANGYYPILSRMNKVVAVCSY